MASDLQSLVLDLLVAARPFRDLHVSFFHPTDRIDAGGSDRVVAAIQARSRDLYQAIRSFTKLPSYEVAEYIKGETEKFIKDLMRLSQSNAIGFSGQDSDIILQAHKNIDRLLYVIIQHPELRDKALPSLPPPRPAPIQVEVADQRIRLTHSQTRTGSIDYPAANRVRASLFETFDELVSALPSSSNADTRYIRACQVLRDYLGQDLETISIEALGLSYQLVEKITRRLSHEMGGTQLDEIEHVLVGVGVLLNQFEEWRAYLTELAKTKLDPENGSLLVEQGQRLIAEMEKPGVPVDPAVVRRLREMVEPVVTGIVSADAVAVPLVCSLSNVFSLLSQVAIDHVTSAHGLIEHTALMGTAALLVDFSVYMIRTFFPILSQFQPLHFILSVADYLNKRYSQWKDATSV